MLGTIQKSRGRPRKSSTAWIANIEPVWTITALTAPLSAWE
jgi:hypothetical protein